MMQVARYVHLIKNKQFVCFFFLFMLCCDLSCILKRHSTGHIMNNEEYSQHTDTCRQRENHG
jgi:hypothetical protein